MSYFKQWKTAFGASLRVYRRENKRKEILSLKKIEKKRSKVI